MRTMQWRATVGGLRLAILASLGGVAHACGGRANLERGGDSFDEITAGGGGRASPTGGGGAPSRGGAGGRGTAGTGTAGTGTAGAAMAGAGGYGGYGYAGSYGYAGYAGSEVMPFNDFLRCDYIVHSVGGWETCRNGIVHRASIRSCPSFLPRSEPIDPALYGGSSSADAGAPLPPGVACTRDSDCTDAAHGYCVVSPYELGVTYCEYGCVADSECGYGQVCQCDDAVGHCVQASCRSDADCGDGLLCSTYTLNPGCGGTGMACQWLEDECRSDADCGNAFCYPRSGGRGRTCAYASCDPGRPFLIRGEQRLAAAAQRSDWCAPELVDRARTAAPPSEAALSAALGQAWTQQALMEHASIAAFARFSLQLLALGAPAELVEAAARAMQDETRHAQACFSLASRYAGARTGPGPLALEGALEGSSWSEVVCNTVLEGCIGETVAALEAAEAAEHCQDPQVQAVLRAIAREEGQHAELAWRFVAWALAQGPASLREEVRSLFAAELAARAAPEAEPASAFEAALLTHGVVSARLRGAVRRRALSEVVRPCAQALFATAAELPNAVAPKAQRAALVG